MKLSKARMGILMVVMLCLLLTGCVNDATSSATTNGATTAPTSEAATAPADTTEPVQTTLPVEDTMTTTETTVPAVTIAPVEPTVPAQTTAPVVQKDPAEDDFVRVADYIPGAIMELKYTTDDNICGKPVYNFHDAYLRYGTVKKLAAVQQELESLGYKLKIWDAYRPASAQFPLWEACKDTMYVTNPYRGFSAYCRGNTVGVTVVDGSGKELEMPTGFDVYTMLADRDYTDCSADAAKNAQFLQDIMEKHGFEGHFAKWWEYMDSQDYEIKQEFLCD